MIWNVIPRSGLRRFRAVWLQWLAGLGEVMVMLLVNGMMMGWSSPYLAKLTSPGSPLPITDDEASWVASLYNLGRLFGAILGATGFQLIGGKRTIVLIGCPIIGAWICVIFANSVVWLYIARFSCGVSIGMAITCFPLFLGEVSEPEVRGSLVSFALAGLPIGIFCGNTIGALVSMEIFAYVAILVSFIFVGIFSYIPDSPHLLAKLGKTNEALRSIRRYHPEANAEAEVESLKMFTRGAEANSSFFGRLRLLATPVNRKATFIAVMLFSFVQVSGFNSVLFYMEIELKKAQLSAISAATVVVISGASAIPACLTSTFLSGHFGRRTLLIVSCVGVIVAMTGIGVHFELLDRGWDPVPLQWLLITWVVAAQIFIYVGLVPVPGMVMSEILSPDVKSVAGCLVSFSAGITAFLSTLSFQPMVDGLGDAWVFWIHALILLMPLLFALTVMPETRGQTLQEIQEMLRKR